MAAELATLRAQVAALIGAQASKPIKASKQAPAPVSAADASALVKQASEVWQAFYTLVASGKIQLRAALNTGTRANGYAVAYWGWIDSADFARKNAAMYAARGLDPNQRGNGLMSLAWLKAPTLASTEARAQLQNAGIVVYPDGHFAVRQELPTGARWLHADDASRFGTTPASASKPASKRKLATTPASASKPASAPTMADRTIASTDASNRAKLAEMAQFIAAGPPANTNLPLSADEAEESIG